VDNGHILVVDDQREICDLVQQYLSSEGYYRVSTAQDGAGPRGPMALVTTPINSRIGTALTARPRLARAAGLLQIRSRENRYGRDRDEAPLPRLKPAS
jgi:CheY-like chemotaxis protein